MNTEYNEDDLNDNPLASSSLGWATNVNLLILANMQDLEGAMSISEVSEKLELSSVQDRDREYFLKGCSAMTGEGLKWLTLAIQGP